MDELEKLLKPIGYSMPRPKGGETTFEEAIPFLTTEDKLVNRLQAVPEFFELYELKESTVTSCMGTGTKDDPLPIMLLSLDLIDVRTKQRVGINCRIPSILVLKQMISMLDGTRRIIDVDAEDRYEFSQEVGASLIALAKEEANKEIEDEPWVALFDDFRKKIY